MKSLLRIKAPKYLTSHPAVQDVEYMLNQSGGDYRWGVYLKEGWVFENSRGMGTGYLNIQNKQAFDDACPVKIAEEATK